MIEGLRLGTSPQKLDLEVIKNGVRREAPMAPGVYFTVLPWGPHNRRFKRAMVKHAEARRAAGIVVDDIASYMMDLQEDPEFVTDALVLDVEGILGAEDKPVPYTRAVGLQILSDPEWANLLDWVVAQSMMANQTRASEIEDAGNSSALASGGKKGGGAASRKTRSSKPG